MKGGINLSTCQRLADIIGGEVIQLTLSYKGILGFYAP
jgi:hypothetical protein